MPAAGGLSSQTIRRGSAAVAAARSLQNVRMPGAAQDVAGPGSVGIRPQMLAVALNASKNNQISNEWLNF